MSPTKPEMEPDGDATILNDQTVRLAATPPAAGALAPGGTAGPATYAESYTVSGLVGQGGIGRVYLGFDQRIGREVAIKELLGCAGGPAMADTTGDPLRARFLREAKITGRLEHPGIVPVHELSAKPDGAPFYVMRYVRGRTFEDAMSDNPPADADEAFAWRMRFLGSLIQVCEAMAYAHARNIIHRDLKPANVVLGEFGETVILDWGLAKEVDDGDGPVPNAVTAGALPNAGGDLTLVGDVLGTPNYMAPEQVNPAFGAVGKASDVYALGTMLYRILTGTLPYQGSGRDPLAALASAAPSPSPRLRRPGLPAELAAICEKAMNKLPGERFTDAAAMADELRAFRDGRLVSVYAYSRRELLRRFLARNKTVVLAAAGIFIATLAGGGFALRYAAEAQQARAQAELALEEVTELGELAQAHALAGVRALDGFFGTFEKDLRAAAQGAWADPDAAARAAYASLSAGRSGLAGLFWIDADGVVRAAVPPPAEPMLGTRFDAHPATRWIQPTAETPTASAFRDGPRASWVGVQVPLLRGGKQAGSIAALLRADRVIAAVVPPAPLFGGRRPDVWAMQRDGLVLYDEDPDYVGTDLFRDRVNTVLPGVVEFGRRMQSEATGVSHYAYFSSDGTGREHYVAAWQTTSLLSDMEWQVVVDYPYVIVRQ